MINIELCMGRRGEAWYVNHSELVNARSARLIVLREDASYRDRDLGDFVAWLNFGQLSDILLEGPELVN